MINITNLNKLKAKLKLKKIIQVKIKMILQKKM